MPNNYTATKRRPRFFVSRLLSLRVARTPRSRIPLYKNLVVLLTTLGALPRHGPPRAGDVLVHLPSHRRGFLRLGALEPRNPPPSPSASP